MEIIDRSTQALIKILSAEDREAVIHYVLGESSDHEHSLVQSLLVEMNDSKYWLQCDCRTNEQSIEHSVKNAAGKLFFSINRGSTEHADICAFHSTSRSNRSKPFSHTRIKSKTLNFHSSINTEEPADQANSRTAAAATGNKIKSIRRSSLGSLLLTLSTDSGINVLDSGAALPDISVLNGAVPSFFAAEKLPLSQVFRASLAPDTQWGLEQVLEKLKPTWPRKSRPYGILADIVESTDGKKIKLFNNNYSMTYHADKTVLAHPQTKGPYLAFCTFTNKPSEPDSKTCYLMRLVLIPVVSRDWIMPVESNYERQAATWLKSAMKKLSKARIHTSLEKPLFDIPVTGGTVRPDFIMRAPNSQKSLIIEVMGYDNIDYQERKHRQIPLMKSLHDLVEVNMACSAGEQENNLKNMYKKVCAHFS